jgi:hypothetical protein
VAKLTSEQIAFLNRHGVSMSEVYDATGMRRKHYYSDMKLLEMRVAIGVTPCTNRGHTMRNRNGRCVQCNPASFAFEKRFEQNAFVYIGGSVRKKIVKVGFSESCHSREEILNRLGYGNASDWKLLFYVRCDKAGEVENEVHKKLERYATQISYIREGHEVDCLELFACSYSEARSAIETVLDKVTMLGSWEREDAATKYNFPAVPGHGFFRKGNRYF